MVVFSPEMLCRSLGAWCRGVMRRIRIGPGNRDRGVAVPGRASCSSSAASSTSHARF